MIHSIHANRFGLRDAGNIYGDLLILQRIFFLNKRIASLEGAELQH